MIAAFQDINAHLLEESIRAAEYSDMRRQMQRTSTCKYTPQCPGSAQAVPSSAQVAAVPSIT